MKEKLRKEWAPEYEVKEFKPVGDTLDTVSERRTSVSLALCLEDKKYMYVNCLVVLCLALAAGCVFPCGV